jgi:hypothetical protein
MHNVASRVVRVVRVTQLFSAVLLAITAPSLAGAQSAVTRAPIISVAGSFFALSVPNLAQSRQWYIDKFGLTPVMESPFRISTRR